MGVTIRIRKSKPKVSRAIQALGLKTNVIAYDTEGTGLIPYGPEDYWGYCPARPFAHAFCDSEGNTAYLRQKVDPHTRRVITDEHDALLLDNVLSDPTVIKIGHNIGYDRRLAKASGRRWSDVEIHDTQILAHVATAGDELSYALKPLAKKWSGYSDADEKELEKAVAVARREAKAKGWLIAGGKKEVDKGEHCVFAGNKPVKADYWLAPPKLCKRYAIGDVERAMLLFLLWFPALHEDPEHGWWTYCREMQLFHVLRRMEERGTRVFPDDTASLITFYEDYKKKMREAATEHGGYNPFKPEQPLNFNSPKQLCEKFYGELGYPIVYSEKPTKKGVYNPTVNKFVLAKWGATDPDTGEYVDPLAKAILEWKAADQTNKSFLKIYQRFWYPISRRRKVFVLHPNYNQSGAVTGRMSCSDPNLQQVAAADTGLRKAEIEQRPREVFGPRPRSIWYLPDYSQMEVWAFAYIAEEPTMQEILLSGHDFHQGVADKSFIKRADYQERRKYYRKLSKLIMFGKLFGAGIGSEAKPGRMTKLLEMPFKETKEFIESFEEEFTEVKRYMKKRTNQAEREHEAFNLYGRRYSFEGDWAYKVVNYLVQGTCADLMKVALMRVDWMLETRWNYPGLGLINQVHDELIIEVPYAVHSKELMRDIVYVMQMDSEFLGLPVPLPVGMSTAKKRWAFKKDVELEPWVLCKAWKDGAPPVNLATWAKKGMPHARTEYYADLERHMRACPHNTKESISSAFEQTRGYLHSFLSADAA
jgi:DNA polymerase I-like protein with 3'-5' exonuclease and polymerase domains